MVVSLKMQSLGDNYIMIDLKRNLSWILWMRSFSWKS